MKSSLKNLLWLGIPLLGLLFSWRLYTIPSRAEIALFFSVVFMLPSFIYPRVALYYLLIVPCFIPMFRRLYYLLAARPDTDYIMLVTDGVLVSMFTAIIMLWVKNKEQNRDKLSAIVLFLVFFMFLKIFFIQQWDILTGFYSFKYYGVYVLYYFAGKYLLNSSRQFVNSIVILSIVMFIVGLYSIKQVYLGYFFFEKIWIESVEFTTLFIEGHIRTFSTLISPAALADTMSLALVIGLFFIFSEKPRAKLWGILVFAGSIPPLLFATVRTNWIASLLSIWFFFYCFFQFKKAPTVINILVIPVFLFLILNFSDGTSEKNSLKAQNNLTGNQSTVTDVMISKRTSALTNPLQEYSLQKRIDTWNTIMLATWYHNPLGSGLGTASYAHSLYFQLLGETGYLGIGLFLTILIMISRRAIILLRQLKNREEILLISCFFTIVITVSILNLTGNHLNAHPLDIVFWFSCGGISHFFARYFIEKTDKIEAVKPEKTLIPAPETRNA